MITLSPCPIPTLHLQDLPKLLLLFCGQTGGELDMIFDDEIPPRTWLLGNGHSEPGIAVGAAWLRWTGLVNVDLLAVDGGDRSLPACEGFLELEVDRMNEIVAFASKEGM